MSHPANQLVEHFFRHESANLVAVLTRVFGLARSELIEDMIQAALMDAMQIWQRGGIPDNPAGWIHRVAKHRILDALRRERTLGHVITQVGASLDDQASLVDEWLEAERLPDSLLRMIFVCCHPSLERKTQIALTLKTLCGFGNAEISRGLLLGEENVKKRIQRARMSLAHAQVAIEFPADDEIARRLDVVHDVLYLLFNEGYCTSQGAEPIRDEICEEAARLCHLLCESAYSTVATRALLALLLLQSARLAARIDAQGSPVLLEDQDRSRWDRRLIYHGMAWLQRSKTEEPGRFHYEAAIALQHCVASSVATTDWQTIVALYDRLLRLHDSPIYVLNRAVALAQLGDTTTALQQLKLLQDQPALSDYMLLECAVARVYELSGNRRDAIAAYRRALPQATAVHERKLLEIRLRRLLDESA